MPQRSAGIILRIGKLLLKYLFPTSGLSALGTGAAATAAGRRTIRPEDLPTGSALPRPVRVFRQAATWTGAGDQRINQFGRCEVHTNIRTQPEGRSTLPIQPPASSQRGAQTGTVQIDMWGVSAVYHALRPGARSL
jgi:hypothetical protein